MAWTRDAVRENLIELICYCREDSNPTVLITDETGIFRDLGLETIDAVGLSSAVEMRFNQVFPFPEFMSMMSRENATDISVGRLLDFLMSHLEPQPE